MSLDLYFQQRLCTLRLQTRAAEGFGGKRGGLCPATTPVLLSENLAACLCSPFLIASPLLLPGEFYYHPLYLSKFLCGSSQAAFFSHHRLPCIPLGGHCNFCNVSFGDMVRCKWHGHQVGRLDVYLLPGMIKSNPYHNHNHNHNHI